VKNAGYGVLKCVAGTVLLVLCFWYYVADTVLLVLCCWYCVFGIMLLVLCCWYCVFGVMLLVLCCWYCVAGTDTEHEVNNGQPQCLCPSVLRPIEQA